MLFTYPFPNDIFKIKLMMSDLPFLFSVPLSAFPPLSFFHSLPFWNDYGEPLIVYVKM